MAPTPVTTRDIDPEQLAALLDGRLGRREREEVLARLAASPESYEAYLDAVALLEEARSEAPRVPESTVVSRLQRMRPSRRQWMGLAAAALLLVVGPLLWTRWQSRADEPVRYGLLLADASQTLPAEWNASPWPATRSAGSPLSSRSRAVRLGARLTELELAVARGDSAAVAAQAGEVVALLDPVTGSGLVTRWYRDLVANPGTGESADEALRQGRAAVAQLPDADLVRAGEWLQAARIAAARHDTLFLRRSDAPAMLQSLLTMPEVPPAARGHLEAARSAVGGGGNVPWPALEQALTSALALLAT